MKPGNRIIISFHSDNPEKTLGFCRSLGFKEVYKSEKGVLLTDGIKLFEVRRSESNFTSLTYLSPVIEEKKEMALNLELPVKEIGRDEFRFSDPNGVPFAVREESKDDDVQLADKPLSLCGTFSEVSIETDDIDRSVRWYENIGFKVTAKEKTYTTLDDGQITLSLYLRGTCPHKFKNPSLTYFEPDMGERIAELKKRGVQFVQEEKEIGMEGHAIAESPDGQYFFLFSV